MGCCESRLLGIEDASAKYESGPVIIEESYNQRKSMVKIGVDKTDEKENRSSLSTLRRNLESVFQKFERQKGLITLSFLDAENKARLPEQGEVQAEERRIENNSNEARRASAGVFSVIGNGSQNSLSLEQSSQSEHLQNNANILSNTSLLTRRQLEKELFYINSNQIGNVKLLKWTEQDRLTCKIDKQLLLTCPTSNIEYSAALYLIRSYEQKHLINLLVFKQLKTGLGFRIFLNGTKRMIHVPIQLTQNAVFDALLRIPHLLKVLNSSITFWVFMMTGWIPETINISGFPNSKQILRKLTKNLNFANLILAFSSKTQSEILLTHSINAESEEITVLKISKKELMPFAYQKANLSWATILKSQQFIHVNWNPFIYSFVKKVEAVGWIKQVSGSKLITVPKFRVSIPPSKTEVEVRILAQIHWRSNLKIKQFELVLYESNNSYICFEQKNVPIRVIGSMGALFVSQIFMFEQCEEASQYIIAIKVRDCESQCQPFEDTDFQVTVDLFTFFQIKADVLQEPELIDKKQLISVFNQQHAGFGMNSPFFNSNLQYSLSAQQGSICNLKVKFDTETPILFEICVLPDRENNQDLTLIKPQHLVRDAIQSNEFQSEAEFEFAITTQNCLILIICFTPSIGKVIIQCELYTFKRSDDDNLSLKLQEIVPKVQFWKELQFFWDEQSPGPRKRTIQNSETKFYPIETFERFFQNPYIDYYLPEGFYQFSVISKNFLQEVAGSSEFEHSEVYCLKLLNTTPPSLSMGIFELNDAKDKVKIIVDDYEYVPYGIGFWTVKLKLAGLYRFVLSKIQQQRQEGIFRIRKFSTP